MSPTRYEVAEDSGTPSMKQMGLVMKRAATVTPPKADG